MTLKELRDKIKRYKSLAEFDEFLCAHLHEVRPLFYGLTRAELKASYIDYEDVFLAFAASSLGREIQKGSEPAASVVALLIFFLSLFERAGLYTDIQAVAEFLPRSSLRNRARAIFSYKYITDSRNDYIQRFDEIVALLQEAWDAEPENHRIRCEDLLLEYALDALLLPRAAGVDLRKALRTRFLDPVARRRYPILNGEAIDSVFGLDDDALACKHRAVRSHIAESLHDEACELVPESLLCRVAEELQGEEAPPIQKYDRLPVFIDSQLKRLGAVYQQKRQDARLNFDATHEDNLVYLGTYFPKTVIEAWNILSELLSIPVVSAAFSQKDIIRILDIGSGTGAAVAGALLALKSWKRCRAPVEVTSIDINRDALAKQQDLLDAMKGTLPFELTVHPCRVELPFNLDEYVPVLSAIADQKGMRYDFIFCWKCLCEFYNVNFASAHGIIFNTLRIASQMLLPYGLFILSDVTTTDNCREFFAMTVNREANHHDSCSESAMRTVLPLPCARSSATCRHTNCYTQRKFILRHRLVASDESKIAYRVFAPNSFAQTIEATFTNHPAYRVNAARTAEACYGGRIGKAETYHPCGYTGFFNGRE